MEKILKIVKRPRIILLALFIVMALVMTYSFPPNFAGGGVAIRGVAKDSSAAIAGIQNPEAYSAPMSREVVKSINNIPIDDEANYWEVVNTFTYNMTVEIKTDLGNYRLVTKPLYEVTILPEKEQIVVNETILVNKTINGTVEEVEQIVQKYVMVNKTKSKIIGVEDIGLVVYDAPTTNIRKGLDLAGGTRVVLRPEEKLSREDFDMLLDSLEQRLNVYGLSDVKVRKTTDLSGTNFVLVELAGAKKSEVNELLGKQGKFEAFIGDTIVFIGGERDITYVAMGGQGAGIDPRQPCGQASDGSIVCRFRFGIALSNEAAQRFAEATRNSEVLTGDGKDYLADDLELFLDDGLVDTLKISADLAGRAETDIEITGSGSGATEQEAALNALESMKGLQTIMKTGSLPTKLEISQLSSISPTLGKSFVENAMFVGLLAILGIIAMIYIRYRKLTIAIPMLITLTSEVIIVLGFAALIGWNVDLAAIAGLIIVIGTSIDHQVVIADEIISGAKASTFSYKERLKRAMFIVMGAWLTTLAAMIPLIWAGAGLLKGFAITTMVGVTIGVFVTRPAFAAMAEILLKE